MVRVARVVAPGVPHHITQRGNRRQLTFFCEEDYRLYEALMAQWCLFHRVEIQAYCLMPNHVHLIVVPSSSEGLRLAIGEAHRRYTLKINKRQGWTGHLWQGRFFSYPMDEAHFLRAVRYVLFNPVRAGICESPEDYLWSNARALATGSSDPLISVNGPIHSVDDWKNLSSVSVNEVDAKLIKLHQNTGRPLGNDQFLARLERDLGRVLREKKKGRRPKTDGLRGATRPAGDLELLEFPAISVRRSVCKTPANK